MLNAIVPLIMIVVGLLLWFVSANPKVSEAGKLTFFAGCIALGMHYASANIRIG